MKITQEADYALRITMNLASNNALTDAATLSNQIAVTQGFTLKILRKLLKVGIVKSIKGAQGGYILKADANTLTVRNVIEAVDGPIRISKCLSDDHVCLNNADKDACRMHHVFDKLNNMLTKRLDKLTIANMVDSSLTLNDILSIID